VTPRYVVGIDLGTTHVSFARAALDQEDATPEIMPITQLVAQATVDDRALLPSFLYLPHSSEGAQPLPWDIERTYAVGEYARSRGIEAPARLVSSAKSWLSYAGIDRRAGTLPMSAPEDVEKISPVEASWRYLEHLSESYASRFGEALADQEIIVTVPASFDAAARDLTVEAVHAAGIERLTLLEEPQAALYAWIGEQGDAWRRQLRVGDVILVVDVGGGTTDLSAIGVSEEDGSLALRRIAVGDHILLGGDNMDLALAHLVKQKLEAQGKEVDRLQLAALTHACRVAKERLLSDPALGVVPVALAGRGSSLLGSTLRTELTRGELELALVEGFFPRVAASARPAVRARTALTQLGLPYASDAAITRHLAAFLGRQASAAGASAGGALLHPTAVLFNGGVMKAMALKTRVLETLNDWLLADGAPAARELESADLDLAVSRGAAYYGLARRGRGLRIRGGTARAYYVGIESAVPAVPGVEPPVTALCVAPFGMEEGSPACELAQELGVVVGEKVVFRFFGSSVRRDDRAGTEVDPERRAGEIEELPPIEITLPTEGRREGDVVAVRLHASITEVGTLLLEAVPRDPKKPGERWRVELSVRGEG
jgi:hypothetical protein